MSTTSNSSSYLATSYYRPKYLGSFRSARSQSLVCKLVVFFVLTVSFTMNNAFVQSFRVGLSHSNVRRGMLKFTSPNFCKANDLKFRKFSSSSISSTENDAVEDVKNKLLKKKASLLKRHVRITGDGSAAPETVTEKKKELDSDVKMAKQVQDDLIAEYARTVSRIPTSIKVSSNEGAKAVDKKPSPVHKKKASVAAQVPAETFNSNSVYTNTEYNAAPSSNTEISRGKAEDYPDENFQSSQLTTSVTNMAFSSLEISANTKRALSEVMKYK